MLKANKKTTMLEGGQAVPHATRQVLEPPDPNRYRNGIFLVVLGLAGQIGAMLVH